MRAPDLEGSAAGFCFRHDFAYGAKPLLVEILDLYFDRLPDLQSVRERLADAGDQLHPQGVKERREDLPRRHHVADGDLLVDHDSPDRGPDRCPFERGLNLIDRFLRAAQFRIG